MIAYKVIDKVTKYGSNAWIYREYGNISEFIADNPEAKKYFPKYEKGKIIRGVKGSPGIFCFENVEDARNFIDVYSEAIIIKVEGIGKMKRKPKILDGCGVHPLYLLHHKETSKSIYKEAITFPSVKVLTGRAITRKK